MQITRMLLLTILNVGYMRQVLICPTFDVCVILPTCDSISAKFDVSHLQNLTSPFEELFDQLKEICKHLY